MRCYKLAVELSTTQKVNKTKIIQNKTNKKNTHVFLENTNFGFK